MMHGMTGTAEMMQPFAEKFYQRIGHYLFPKQDLTTQLEEKLGGDTKTMTPMQQGEPTCRAVN